jgi:hypothetical protein
MNMYFSFKQKSRSLLNRKRESPLCGRGLSPLPYRKAQPEYVFLNKKNILKP